MYRVFLSYQCAARVCLTVFGALLLRFPTARFECHPRFLFRVSSATLELANVLNGNKHRASLFTPFLRSKCKRFLTRQDNFLLPVFPVCTNEKRISRFLWDRRCNDLRSSVDRLFVYNVRIVSARTPVA